MDGNVEGDSSIIAVPNVVPKLRLAAYGVAVADENGVLIESNCTAASIWTLLSPIRNVSIMYISAEKLPC
jgi:hypothetical protein